MKVCGVCGKRIAVMWPEFYVYKHGKGEDTTYYCSENCMIVADTREMKDRIGWVDPQAEMTEEEIEAVTHGRPVGFRRLRKTARREEQPAAPAEKDRPEKPAERTGQDMGNSKNSHKLTREEKEKAVELAIGGKDPLSYLRERGAQNPSAAWWYIKKTLAKSNPKLLEKIPEKLVTVLDEKGQAVPADDSEAADPLEGFTAFDPGAGKKPIKGNEKEFIERLADTVSSAMDPGAPEGDRTEGLEIRSDNVPAAEDPAVKRMEVLAAVTKTDMVPPVASRLVMDEHGLHTVQEKPEQNHSMGLDEAVRKMDEALKSPDFMEVRQTADGITIRKKKPSYEVMELFGIPCEVTGVKLEGFEFGKVSEGLRVDFPGGSLLWGTGPAVPVIMDAEQWKRLAEILPKVMQILRIE